MLVQQANGKVLLLPAWPAIWDADFKLHLEDEGVISGKVVDGKLVEWSISPRSREKDVVVYEPQGLSPQVTTTGPESAQIPANELDLRIGLDHSGSSRFMGQIGRATIFRGAINPETIAALAQSNREEKIQDGQAVTCALSPKVGDVLPFDHEQLGKTVSFEAWIKPADRESGRLFDKLTAGQRNGFLIDCWPRNSIRLIVGPAEKVYRDVLRPDQWQHIAVIIGPNHLEAYLDGKKL